METVLEEMLNSVLVIPFQKDLISKLSTLSKNYAKSIDRAKVENCVSAFLLGTSNTPLHTYIIKQNKGQFINLPPIVYKILSEYIVYMLIIDKDDKFYDGNKVIYSLIVRNMMVSCKNSYSKLLAPEFLTSMYPFSDSYREEKSVIEECSEKQITPDIFVHDNFEDMNLTLNEDLFNEVKQLAQQSAKLEYQKLISDIKSKGIEDPFILAYHAAKELAVTPQWKYVDVNPVTTIIDILPTNRGNIKLKNIKGKLIDSEYYHHHHTQSKSSILLNYIGNIDAINKIGDLQLSALEFAIYMYYEFFLEELIKG